MKNKIIENIESKQLNKNLIDFKIGQNVKVYVRG